MQLLRAKVFGEWQETEVRDLRVFLNDAIDIVFQKKDEQVVRTFFPNSELQFESETRDIPLDEATSEDYKHLVRHVHFGDFSALSIFGDGMKMYMGERNYIIVHPNGDIEHQEAQWDKENPSYSPSINTREQWLERNGYSTNRMSIVHLPEEGSKDQYPKMIHYIRVSDEQWAQEDIMTMDDFLGWKKICNVSDAYTYQAALRYSSKRG